MIVLRVVAFAAGVVMVGWVLRSAIRTMVVPRGEHVVLTRLVFELNRRVYTLLSTRRRNVERRAATLAGFAPASMIVLAATWAVLIMIAFVLVYWSLGEHDLKNSIYLSGSSLTTLGFVKPEGSVESIAAVIEALLGLAIVALLISYLPTIYGLFNRREVEVTKLDVRAGSPPTAVEMLVRFYRIGWLDRLDDTWSAWEEWFSVVEESHSSHPSLVFFRSQRPNSSWVTCAGAVLDSAAITQSVLDIPSSAHANIMLRSGFMCLRAIASYFGIPFDPNPNPNAPISIHREEFDILVAALEEEGLPVRADREGAWRDFAGWRVNYDVVLLGLCALVEAPPTPWSSDRLGELHPPTWRRHHWVVDPFETPESW